MRDDRSIMDLMTADYTFLNERLAKRYGIRRLGSHFRRVTLADEARKALLGRGAILAVTSFPTRTSPVVAGSRCWRHRRNPAATAAAGMCALTENAREKKPRSMRDRLEEPIAGIRLCLLRSHHGIRSDFRWTVRCRRHRARDGGRPGDRVAALANGIKVDGPVSLRRALVSDPTVFVTTATEQMMVYALGHGWKLDHHRPCDRSLRRRSRTTSFRRWLPVL